MEVKEIRKKLVKDARRVVVKVGSAVVGERDFASIAEDICALISGGKEVVLVSSGSVAMGMKKMGLNERPSEIPRLQAVAALGQTDLMSRYESAFARFDKLVAQVLLTHDDLGDRKRFLNARNTITTLLKMGVVPIINENDTVAVDEIKFGDNDNLAALTSNLIEADTLVMLSDIDGIYDKNPKGHKDAKRYDVIEDIDAIDIDLSSVDTNRYGTGGIATKVSSASTAAHFGTVTVVANGFKPGVITEIFNGEDVGTFILPKEDRLSSRKHWITYSARTTGRVVLDDGARGALIDKGKSLLPSGILDVDGSFDSGEVVHCVDTAGMEFARGVVNYSSAEIVKIKGLKTTEIEKTLGYKVYDEVIHRDNLVVL